MNISIISINRNNEQGLEDTVQSVLQQLSSPQEYIIVDGASTDKSVEVIKRHEDRITHWISEPDGGIYNAMNKGIALAKNNYLLFLNSGDKLADTSIIKFLAEADFTEDIIYGNILYDGDAAPMIMPDKITLATFLGPSIGHGASFIRKELFEKHGLYNEKNKIVSDWEFFLHVFVNAGCTYRHINRTITVYQKGGVSTNPLYNHVQEEERRTALKKVFPAFYDTIAENFLLKEKLQAYERSRALQLFKKYWDGFRRLSRKKYSPPPGHA